MLTRLSIENYRAFEEVQVDLSKINLFFGPNNSGKSSLVSLLTLLSQTLQSPDPNIFLLMSGKYQDLGTYYDMVYDNDESRKIKVSIQAKLTASRRQMDEERSLMKTVEVELPEYIFEASFGYRRQRHETLLQRTELIEPDSGRSILRTRYSSRLGRPVIDWSDPSLGLKLSRANAVLQTVNFIPTLPRVLLRPQRSSWDVTTYLTSLHKLISEVEYLGPFRAYPARVYLVSGESPSSVGTQGERAIDIMVSDDKRRGKQKRGIVRGVSEWMDKAGIANRVDIFSMTDRHFELMVKNAETGELQNLADTGFGCSQVLPVLVAGLTAEKDRILAVEQPEIHLHPKSQAELGSFFCDVAKKGVQLILETHSEHLLLRIQSHVAAGDLSPEDVHVFYFDHENIEGKERKVVRRIPLGEDGLFQAKWPKGFFPERLAEAKRLAKASVR